MPTSSGSRWTVPPPSSWWRRSRARARSEPRGFYAGPMSAIRLLVLGAVRQHGRAHGYQVRNDLEYWGAHEWSNAKPGSIYHALKQMAKQGLLHAHEVAPSTAGGPPRTEYELTEQG